MSPLSVFRAPVVWERPDVPVGIRCITRCQLNREDEEQIELAHKLGNIELEVALENRMMVRWKQCAGYVLANEQEDVPIACTLVNINVEGQ